MLGGGDDELRVGGLGCRASRLPFKRLGIAHDEIPHLLRIWP